MRISDCSSDVCSSDLLTDNIVHLVLARTTDAPAGTRGISLFLVPKMRLDGTPNDVRCVSVEHKMGIHASPTCVLSSGDHDDCHGRSEERRVGKEMVSTCRSLWTPYHEKTTIIK